MNISLDHGNSPTLHYVTVGPFDFAFSYSTIVAFRDDTGWVKSENVWSATTGKHLNEIPGERIKNDEFERRLKELLDDLTLVSTER